MITLVVQQTIDFFTALVDTWSSYWQSFAAMIEAFARIGLHPFVEALNTCGSDCKSSTVTTQLMGGIYVIGSTVPMFLVVYAFTRKFFLKKKQAMFIAVSFVLFWIASRAYIFRIAPTPGEKFNQVAHGPTTVINVLSNVGYVDAFGILSAFIFFVAISFFMWYGINLIIWSVGLMFKSDPPFGSTGASAKGHAMWLTGMWIFFLSILPAPAAFVNNLIMLGVVILHRSSKDKNTSAAKMKKLIDEQAKMAAQQNPPAEQEPEPEPQNIEESESDSKITWE